MQRLGQHFLKNKSALKKIADALDIQRGERVIEIGPGHGELTSLLLERGAEIIAIEKDANLAAALKKEIGGVDIEIIEGDALKMLQKIKIERPYKIVGNIPYYITGKLFRTMSELEQKPKSAVFLIQKEVAERMCAEPPDMNRLAASVQFWAGPKMIAVVPRGEFSPPPKVDSAVISFKTKENTSEVHSERYYAAVRSAFAQPRKTILNNISAAFPKNKSVIAEGLTNLGIIPESRPQDLSTKDIVAIAQTFF